MKTRNNTPEKEKKFLYVSPYSMSCVVSVRKLPVVLGKVLHFLFADTDFFKQSMFCISKIYFTIEILQKKYFSIYWLNGFKRRLVLNEKNNAVKISSNRNILSRYLAMNILPWAFLFRNDAVQPENLYQEPRFGGRRGA